MELSREEIFKKVYDFHGHICLMSTAGIRIALAAMNAIALKKGDEYLFAFYYAKTCALDPIQFITGCTMGNGNIIVNDERRNRLELVREENGVGVSVALKLEISAKMKNCMDIKKESEAITDNALKSVLKENFNNEFKRVLTMLQNEKESALFDIATLSADITPYLKR